jgi:hypothetical protein
VKIALIVVGCLLALMAVLLCLRAGVLAEYSEDGVLVQVRMAFLRFTVVPAPKKSRNKKRKEPKKKAEPGKKAAVRKVLPKKGGSLSGLLSLLSMGLETLGDLCRLLRIEYLRIHYTIAGQPDPAGAALQYGGIQVGGDAVCLLLEQHLHILQRDISAEVDFCSENSVIYAAASCSLRVGQMLVVAFKLLMRYWTWKKRQNSAAEEENTYG